MTEHATTMDEIKTNLLDAALIHVPFDGWSETAFRTAIADSGVDPALARAACPRGAVDLAVAFHRRGDDEMARRLSQIDLAAMRIRDRAITAIRFRLEAMEDKELVRRGTTLFALPQHAGDGARAVWGTADRIWTALGDGSTDINWYTKRATLCAVYSATVLYWLGDETPGHAATWEFLDRRIGNVMQFEKFKAQVRGNRLLKPFLVCPNWMAGQVKAPHARRPMPGQITPQTAE
ncbi:ubiquinone biosynthesis protein COQ9 [Rhodovulum imhoffii]|uniref:Ubiquinone biosynthesis protein COQ9 n=1 Tax=Rhodovulum imhoffii TaxID=365340 RepID=A0A2T5BU60_9RHOB|nr:COQ9 family protein [Rhodovulum imhoffii]MBK5934569.1 ubiquinone biosynthesis protein [Rhodovulum imhoffii]PTN03014.1 ubiquinone biosynthesis protein COQ9 [Rhodovulum imhoffii]